MSDTSPVHGYWPLKMPGYTLSAMGFTSPPKSTKWVGFKTSSGSLAHAFRSLDHAAPVKFLEQELGPDSSGLVAIRLVSLWSQLLVFRSISGLRRVSDCFCIFHLSFEACVSLSLSPLAPLSLSPLSISLPPSMYLSLLWFAVLCLCLPLYLPPLSSRFVVLNRIVWTSWNCKAPAWEEVLNPEKAWELNWSRASPLVLSLLDSRPAMLKWLTLRDISPPSDPLQ